MWKRFALGATVLAVVAASLAAMRQAGSSRHAAAGVVLTPPEGGRIRLRHEAIDGYMPAMTMEFAYGGRGRALSPGDRVRFTLRVGAGRSWIEDLEITGHTEPVKGDAAAASVARLHEGDRLPEMSLVDQDGLGMTGDDLAGHLTVVTFIFTRCPVPDYCPLMSRRFVQVQSALTADPSLPPDVRLLSITIDPAFDTAPVLKAYAQALGADPARWRFAGGDLAEVTRVARAFSVYVERNGALLDHTLATALVDRSGRVATIWRGNGWKVAEVLDAVRSAGDAGEIAKLRWRNDPGVGGLR